MGDPSGSSVLMHFDSMNSLMDYLFEMYYSQVFNLSPVELRNLETHPVELETVAQPPPFDGFAEMNSSTSSLTNRNSDNTDNHVVDNRFDHTYHAVIGNKPKGKSYKN